MNAPHEQRWAEAIARDVIDPEPLKPSDQEFVDTMITGSIPHQKERAFLDGLGQMFEEHSPAQAMDPATRAMIDAVLVEIDAPPSPTDELSYEDHRRGRVRRWWGAVAVAGGVLAAGLVAAWWGNPLSQVLERAPVATPSMASSAASLVFRSGEVLIDDRPVARSRVRVEPGETIETREGTACLDFEHGGRVCLHPHSRATIGTVETPEVQAPEINVERGRVVGSLGASAERALVLRGHSVVARASAEAVFSLEVPESDEDRVTLEAIRGQLDLPANDDHIQAPGRRVRDSAGWRSVERDPQRSRDDEALLKHSVEPERVISARLSVESDPPGAQVLLDGRSVGRTPLSLAVEPGERSIELEYPGHAPVHEQLSVTREDALERRFSLPPSVGAPEAPPPAGRSGLSRDSAGRGSSRTVEALVLDARAQLAAGDYAEAARRYRTLRSAHPRSREARAALVSLGQLYLDRLGRPRDALKMFKRYLDGGRGPLAEEARWGRTQALRRLDNQTREIAAIEAYLEHHPRSARANSLRQRLAAVE